jgi:hypothetical protein
MIAQVVLWPSLHEPELNVKISSAALAVELPEENSNGRQQ